MGRVLLHHAARCRARNRDRDGRDRCRAPGVVSIGRTRLLPPGRDHDRRRGDGRNCAGGGGTTRVWPPCRGKQAQLSVARARMGPEAWATVAHVCGDVTTGSAHPGDEAGHYAENPAEAWAEVYRILAERTAGMPGNTWSIVVGRYFPDDAVPRRCAGRRRPPGTTPTTCRFAGTFTTKGKRQWQRTIATPLDGRHGQALMPPAAAPPDPPRGERPTALAHWRAFTADANDLDDRSADSASVVLRVTRGTGPAPSPSS